MNWLTLIGLQIYKSNFQEQGVNGKILLVISEFDLKFELKMNLGDRKNLLLELAKLKESQGLSDVKMESSPMITI